MKRIFDFTVALALLVMLAPVMGIIALAILIADGRPVLFGQMRPGLNAVPWTMYKFRTMRPATDEVERWWGDDVRMTPLGKFLRRTSLDELPQLIHVISGRMSLVGPRPLLVEFLPRYSAEHSRRHSVRPGITGLAQINGRSALSLGQRLDLDISYVDNWSFWLDMKILIYSLIVPFQHGYVEGQSQQDVDDVGLCTVGQPR